MRALKLWHEMQRGWSIDLVPGRSHWLRAFWPLARPATSCTTRQAVALSPHTLNTHYYAGLQGSELRQPRPDKKRCFSFLTRFEEKQSCSIIFDGSRSPSRVALSFDLAPKASSISQPPIQSCNPPRNASHICCRVRKPLARLRLTREAQTTFGEFSQPDF